MFKHIWEKSSEKTSDFSWATTEDIYGSQAKKKVKPFQVVKRCEQAYRQER